MAFLPDGRILVTEQWRQWVRVVVNGAFASVDPAGVIDSAAVSPEQGLLGIAVDPRWPAHPYVYLQYSHDASDAIRIARYAMTGDLDGTGDGHLVLDHASRRLILNDLPDLVWNHNGGILRFGADGMLYSSLGDDGRPCDTQSKEILRGKILRLRVLDLPDGPGPPPALADITPADNPFVLHANPRARLVWAFGLRNPYNFHLDAATGWMVIADVGAAGEEEVDVATSPGLNFGWPMYEGFQPRLACANADTGGVRPEFPIATYLRDPEIGLSAVIASGMYRPVNGGASNLPPEYEGSIFFSDVYSGFLRRLVLDGGTWRIADPVPGQPSAADWGQGFAGVTDYLVGPDGAIWYCKYGEPIPGVGYGPGEIRRLRWNGTAGVAPEPSTPPLAFETPAPSPSRGAVRFAWRLEAETRCSIALHDATGALVRRSAVERFPAGRHQWTWDRRDDAGRRVPPGLYWARLAAGAATAVQRVVVLD
jgi:glucose/arabinose dehydrogenase